MTQEYKQERKLREMCQEYLDGEYNPIIEDWGRLQVLSVHKSKKLVNGEPVTTCKHAYCVEAVLQLAMKGEEYQDANGATDRTINVLDLAQCTKICNYINDMRNAIFGTQCTTESEIDLKRFKREEQAPYMCQLKQCRKILESDLKEKQKQRSHV